ncbi:2'-5' RNA ligase family protein [Planomonospora algeriensis]
MRLEHKSVAVSPGAALADAPKGTVECLVAITGVEDNVGDIIMPAAFARTLATRRPKGVFSHDTTTWVSRAEKVEEWLPGDPRLPKTTKDGQPWPAGAGAVYVRALFNLNTKAGRSAYENVAFYSESNEQEWSIGYSVPPGGARKDSRTGVRKIYDLDWYEFSPVLFGAASQTTTLSVKSGLSGRKADAWEQRPGIAPPEQEQVQVPVEQARSMVSLAVPVDVAEAVAVAGGLAPQELHVTLAYLGQGVEEDMLAEAALVVEQVAVEAGPLEGVIGGIGVFPENEDGVPVWVPVDVPGLAELRARVTAALDEAGIWYATGHGFTPHVTLAYLEPGQAPPPPVPAVPVSFGAITLAVEDEHENFPLTGDGTTMPAAGDLTADLDADRGDDDFDMQVKQFIGFGWETKAGRVLSDRNLKRMRQAVDILTEIMKEAGGWEEPPGNGPARRGFPELPPEPSITPDSTAPSALPTELKALTGEQVRAGRDILGFLAAR